MWRSVIPAWVRELYSCFRRESGPSRLRVSATAHRKSGLHFDFGRLGFFRAAVAIEQVGQLQSQITGICRIRDSSVEINGAGAQQFFELAVEMLHAVGIPIAHGVQQRLAFSLAFFDVVARAQSGFENLDGSDASLAVLFRKQAL